MITQDKPLVLYNAEKQEIVGYFSTPSLAGRYIFGNSKQCNRRCQLVYYSANNRGKILKSELPFKCAVRYANKEQAEILGGNDYLIVNGYKKPSDTYMKGFADTRLSLYKAHCELKYRI